MTPRYVVNGPFSLFSGTLPAGAGWTDPDVVLNTRGASVVQLWIVYEPPADATGRLRLRAEADNGTENWFDVTRQNSLVFADGEALVASHGPAIDRAPQDACAVQITYAVPLGANFMRFRFAECEDVPPGTAIVTASVVSPTL